MSRDKARQQDNWEEDDQDDFYDEPPERPTRSRATKRRRKRRSVWPWLLMGCAGGVILLVITAVIVVSLALRAATSGGNLGSIGGVTNPTTYTQTIPPQPLLQLTTITQMNIRNPIGDIIITVDPTATSPTVTAVKKVKAANSDAANKEFDNIVVQVQPPGTPPTTLSVSVSVPGAGGIFGNHNDTVDLTITLPPQAPGLSTTTATTATVTASSPTPTASPTSATTPLILAVDVSSGNVIVNGLSGDLDIKDTSGNITVNNATLADGSHLATGEGNVTFTGNLNLTPNVGNTTARYKIQCETGTVEVTLPSTTNVILDANTNVGAITSDFPISVKTTDRAANFYGPLLANSQQGLPQAVLTLDISTGHIAVHSA